MKTIFAGAFFIACAFLVSCRKEKLPQSSPAESSSQKNDIVNNARAGKYTNPFESLGIEHNQALEFVTHASGFPNLSNQQLYDAVSPFTAALHHNPKMSPAEYQDFRTRIDKMVESSNNPASLLLKEGKISLEMKNLMDEFYHILEPFGKSLAPLSPNELNAKVLAFEQSTVARFGMPSADLNHNTIIAAILADAAVARHSYAFWYDAYTNSSNPWHPLLTQTNNNSRPNWRRACAIVKADIVGFFSDIGQVPGFIDLGNAIENAIDASAAI
jgi:hypothetical protein